MLIKIEDMEFDSKDIKRLYPAVLVKTGYKDETTEVSLEWIDVEAKDRVEVVNYGIFIILQNEKKYSFLYKDRLSLDNAIALLSKQLQ
jgi:hypothetical protein